MTDPDDPRELAKTLTVYNLKLAINEAWKLLQASGSTPAPTLSPRETIQLYRALCQGASFLAFEAPALAGTGAPVETSEWLDRLSPETMLEIHRAREAVRLGK